jgi:hypothetical protein
MIIRAQIAHETPGRVRVRLPDLRGDAEAFARLEDTLLESQLFQGVRANPVTASLVLEFSGPREQVLEALRARLPFELEFSAAPAASRVPSRADSQVDPVRLVSGKDINAMFLAGTLFGAVGLVQAFRGRIMLPALSAFWCASNAFRLARAEKGDEAAVNEASATSG